VALIGMWGAENIDAVLDKDLLEKAGLPVVGVRSGSSALRSKGALFHVRASYREEVQRILDQVQTMGSSRIAVIYEDTDFGREAWADAQAALARRNLKPLAVAVQAQQRPQGRCHGAKNCRRRTPGRAAGGQHPCGRGSDQGAAGEELTSLHLHHFDRGCRAAGDTTGRHGGRCGRGPGGAQPLQGHGTDCHGLQAADGLAGH
jgi:hypothetical protein